MDKIGKEMISFLRLNILEFIVIRKELKKILRIRGKGYK